MLCYAHNRILKLGEANLEMVLQVDKEGKGDSTQNSFLIESVFDLLQLHHLLLVQNLEGMKRL